MTPFGSKLTYSDPLTPWLQQSVHVIFNKTQTTAKQSPVTPTPNVLMTVAGLH